MQLTNTKSTSLEKETVFISYSHKDVKALKYLQVHLTPLSQDFGIDVWEDTRLKIGSKWREEIKEAINRAKIAVLLISPDFMASEFISSNELPPLLEGAKENGVAIMPIILSHSLFSEDNKLNQYQAANNPNKPLYKLLKVERDEVLSNVARRIKEYFSAN